MSNADLNDLNEWKEILDCINHLCKSIGLQVNSFKTIVHFKGLSETEMVPYRSLLVFPFLALHLGFKYLGFFLKIGMQRDVLIMSNADLNDLNEWKEILDCINLFCKSTRLQINSSKTTVHFEALSET
jgi:hypothetical protein